MHHRMLGFCLAAAASMGCAPDAPDAAAPPLAQSLSLDEARARLSIARQTRGLSATDTTEVARFSAYVTQTFEGVSAPIEYMKAKCPDKLLNAASDPLYGLEAPYAVRHATTKASGIAALPIKDVNPAVAKAYTGDYVIIDLDGALVSVFPEGVQMLDAQGKVVDAGAKILRQVSAVAAVAPWQEEDDDGRLWTGVRLTAQAGTPVPPPPAFKDVLAAEWKEPCK